MKQPPIHLDALIAEDAYLSKGRRKYHERLDTDHYLMTPYEAFWTRLPEECKLNLFLERTESELNESKQI